MNVKCTRKEQNYEVITDDQICIEDVNKVSIIDTERPNDYEYGYIRQDTNTFREYHVSNSLSVCPYCGTLCATGQINCGCTSYSIVDEDYVLNELSIASEEDYIQIIAYR